MRVRAGRDRETDRSGASGGRRARVRGPPRVGRCGPGSREQETPPRGSGCRVSESPGAGRGVCSLWRRRDQKFGGFEAGALVVYKRASRDHVPGWPRARGSGRNAHGSQARLLRGAFQTQRPRWRELGARAEHSEGLACGPSQRWVPSPPPRRGTGCARVDRTLLLFWSISLSAGTWGGERERMSDRCPGIWINSSFASAALCAGRFSWAVPGAPQGESCSPISGSETAAQEVSRSPLCGRFLPDVRGLGWAGLRGGVLIILNIPAICRDL